MSWATFRSASSGLWLFVLGFKVQPACAWLGVGPILARLVGFRFGAPAFKLSSVPFVAFEMQALDLQAS